MLEIWIYKNNVLNEKTKDKNNKNNNLNKKQIIDNK